jgi:hypothetical protein
VSARRAGCDGRSVLQRIVVMGRPVPALVGCRPLSTTVGRLGSAPRARADSGRA